MRYISRFTIFLVFNILLSACKKDDEPSVENNLDNSNLIEYQEDGGDRVYKEIYAYDTNFNLTGAALSLTDGINRDVSVKYNEKGQLQNTDWLIWYTPEFFYDSEGRLRKIVTAHAVPGGPEYTYSFLEYDKKGHLSQKTSFYAGNLGLQDLYNADFNSFLEEVKNMYNGTDDYWQQEKIREALDNIYCSKYIVDEQTKTVTEIYNYASFANNRKFGDRVELIWDVTKYDGKKSPIGSNKWRHLNIFLNAKDFSELGNVLENSNESPGRNTFEIFKRTYEYNADGYPISAVQVSALKQTKLTWKYDCK
jgi:hypothetical protein